MEYITLQNSDLTVSRLCMGGCPLGGYGWGQTQEDELIAAVHCALDLGVTMFDTADTYGLGQSERTLGKALSGHRQDVVLATKFGVRVGDGKTVYDNSPEWIREACEASLRRLGSDYIDLYQVHYRDQTTPVSQVVSTLDALCKEGKIRFYGLSNVHRSELSELQPYSGHFVSFQDEYSLACRKNEQDLLNLAQAMQMTPMTWGSLGQGILTGKYGRNCSFGTDDRRSRDVYVNFHGEKLLKNLEIVDHLREIAAARGTGIPAVAIRFILDHLPGSVVLCGAKRPSQIEDQLRCMDWQLTPEELHDLDQISASAD